MPSPRIGLVGCGNWGANILRDLLRLDCAVTVVCRSDPARRRALGLGAAAAADAVRRLPKLDGVIVATPTVTHAEVLNEVLALGVPVFVEKPMTCDLPSALALADAAPARLFVMDKWRYHPGVELLAAIAREQRLGRVLGLSTQRLSWGNTHSDVDGIWVLAPHDLAIGLEVLGSVPAVKSAFGHSVDGVPTGIVARLGDDPWFTLEVSTRYPQHRREVHLHCEGGIAVLDDGYSESVRILRGRPSDHGQSRAEERLPIGDEMPLLRELQAFLEHLRGGPPPRSGAAEGALIVRRITEMRAAAGFPITGGRP